MCGEWERLLTSASAANERATRQYPMMCGDGYTMYRRRRRSVLETGNTFLIDDYRRAAHPQNLTKIGRGCGGGGQSIPSICVAVSSRCQLTSQHTHTHTHGTYYNSHPRFRLVPSIPVHHPGQQPNSRLYHILNDTVLKPWIPAFLVNIRIVWEILFTDQNSSIRWSMNVLTPSHLSTYTNQI